MKKGEWAGEEERKEDRATFENPAVEGWLSRGGHDDRKGKLRHIGQRRSRYERDDEAKCRGMEPGRRAGNEERREDLCLLKQGADPEWYGGQGKGRGIIGKGKEGGSQRKKLE